MVHKRIEPLILIGVVFSLLLLHLTCPPFSLKTEKLTVKEIMIIYIVNKSYSTCQNDLTICVHMLSCAFVYKTEVQKINSQS